MSSQQGNHGGEAIFINQTRTSFIVEKSTVFDHENLECLYVRIKSNSNVEINLVVINIPPNKEEQLKILSDKIQSAGLKMLLY